jgi:hypothetical protein
VIKRAELVAEVASYRNLVSLLSEAGQLLFAGQRADGTERVHKSVVDYAKRIGEPVVRASALIETVGALAAIGDTIASDAAGEALARLDEAPAEAAEKTSLLIKAVRVLSKVCSRDIISTIIARGRASTEAIQDDYNRRRALSELSRAAMNAKFCEDALSIWRSEFALAVQKGFSEGLRSVAVGAGVLAARDNGATLWGIYEDLVKLRRWWGISESCGPEPVASR